MKGEKASLLANKFKAGAVKRREKKHFHRIFVNKKKKMRAGLKTRKMRNLLRLEWNRRYSQFIRLMVFGNTCSQFRIHSVFKWRFALIYSFDLVGFGVRTVFLSMKLQQSMVSTAQGIFWWCRLNFCHILFNNSVKRLPATNEIPAGQGSDPPSIFESGLHNCLKHYLNFGRKQLVDRKELSK